MFDVNETLRKTILNVAGMSGLAPLAMPFFGGLGAILMLHSVTAKPRHPDGFNRHLTVTPAFLDSVIAGMKADRYDFVSIDEAIDRIKTPVRGKRFAAITLDDGYRDNLLEALPVFEKHQTPFAVYIAPAMIDGTIDLWWEAVEEAVLSRTRLYVNTPDGRVTLDCLSPARKAESILKLRDYLTIDVSEADQQAVVREIAGAAGIDVPRLQRNRLMDWEQLRELASNPLATIGAHTVSHRNLARLSEDEARREIREAVRIIESEIGIAPVHMAYPYGHAGTVGPREVALAKEVGFRSAVTTRHGVIRRGHAGHMTALPRISLNGRYQKLAHVRAMLSGITTPMANAGRILATV
jgi:peptidoglycan/xylan/chitin deacetylase (PgdA/CDA1 family)